MHERVKKTLSLTKKCMFNKSEHQSSCSCTIRVVGYFENFAFNKINTTDTGSQLTCGIAKTKAIALSVCPKFRTITIHFVFLIHT